MYLNQKRWVGGVGRRSFGVKKRSFLSQRAHWPEKLLTSPGQGRKDPKKWFSVPGDPARADTRLPRHFYVMKEFYKCFKITTLT